MAEPVRVGIIGAGYWGTKLVQEYLSSERSKGKLKLVKVCDSSLPALLACKKKFGIDDNSLAQNVRDLIEAPEISAVHIASPNHTHYALAKMALEAGKDVLVEKPMTLDSREAYGLVDLAASKGRVLHVGHIFRFSSALREAHQILRSGGIGKIFYARVQWTDSCYFPDRNIIFDLGPHPVDVLNLLLEAWPTQVSAFGRAYRNSRQHYEVAYGIAEFDDGVFAHIELSWLHPSKVREASIVGSDGTLVIDCLAQRVLLSNGNGTEELLISPSNTIESEIDRFADCVARRDISPTSGLIGARTVEVLEAMRSSLWERPLSISVPPTADDIAALIPVLEMTGNWIIQPGLASSKSGNIELQRHVGALVRLGLVRKVATGKGIDYELSDMGARFLKEYRDIQADLRASRPYETRRTSKSEHLTSR